MQRFKNILVYYDEITGDEATLSRAVELAKANHSRLTVMEVISNGSDQSMTEPLARLERLTSSIKTEGVDVCAMVQRGTPFLEVVLQVLHNNHDLVLMTADSLDSFKHLLFGSTSMHLMRKCPCPVWVTKPTERRTYARILAAIDVNSSSPQARALNIEIMDLATSLARIDGAMLDIAHMWEVSNSDFDTLQSEITEEKKQEMLNKYEQENRLKLEALLSGYAMEEIDHQVHLSRGRPGPLIPELADKLNVNLIVMGTVCRTGVAGYFIGNTAETVLRLVDCSVLTVKPNGFVSPVSLHG